MFAAGSSIRPGQVRKQGALNLILSISLDIAQEVAVTVDILAVESVYAIASPCTHMQASTPCCNAYTPPRLFIVQGGQQTTNIISCALRPM